jgi:hypothetical protein
METSLCRRLTEYGPHLTHGHDDIPRALVKSASLTPVLEAVWGVAIPSGVCYLIRTHRPKSAAGRAL